jgi:hypothetical protein
MDLTDNRRAILRLALGLTVSNDPTHNTYQHEWRSSSDCESMVKDGLMTCCEALGGGVFYRATVAGLRAVWGRPAIYEMTGDEVTARETEKRIHIYWQGPPKGRFRTGEIYRVSKSTVRWL